MQPLSRRSFLLASAATALTACARLPRTGSAAAGGAAQARAIYNSVFERMLALAPETATSLGLDVGDRAPLKSRLTDRARLGRTGWWGPLVEALPQLRAIEASSLPLRERAWLSTAIWFAERAVESRSIPYGSGQTPYVLTQLYGSYISVPNFLDTQHTIETTADADAYLDRLDAFHRNIDAEVAMAREDAAAGVVPPAFILDKALRQTRALAAERGAESGMVRSLVRRAREKSLAGDWEARAVRIVDGPIAASLGRQAALLDELKRRAGDAAGVSRLPQGREFYAQALRWFTSTDMPAEAVHRLGLEQVAALTAEAEPLLRQQGVAESGPIGLRIAAIERQSGQLYAGDDAGREQLLAYIRELMGTLRARMPELFHSLPTSPMEVRRVPVAIEVGSAGAYAQGGNLEGTRPGIFYINLQDVSSRPRFTLPTLTAHEAVPGHLWQDAVVNRARDIPLLFRSTGISAFGEGWGLYAETLADELGLYRNDPLGRIGMIQSFLFRAARLVVDSGMHAMGWSREQAIRYFMDTVGRNRAASERDIDRYIVRPGQATAYKIGHNEMLRIREETRRRLGPRFDIKAYHKLVLLSGDMPLEVLASLARQWDGSRIA
ncbi:MAG TPA: DUF885 family protein [Allosphingosinicella sp.]|jgi:uncharacterized protein (DUF885 family)